MAVDVGERGLLYKAGVALKLPNPKTERNRPATLKYRPAEIVEILGQKDDVLDAR